MKHVTRRELITTALAGSAYLAASSILRRPAQAGAAATTESVKPISCQWLDSRPILAGAECGATCGVPWPRGQVWPKQQLRIEGDGNEVPSQTWTTAYWPDGSVKWSAIAVGPGAGKHDIFAVSAGDDTTRPSGAAAAAIDARVSADAIQIDTGVIVATVATGGNALIHEVTRGGKPIAQNARLIALRQDDDTDSPVTRREAFTSKVLTASLEQSGPIRAVVKLTGVHAAGGRQWLPFVVRLYFYAGSDVLRIVHSFVWDGDENKDFLAGLGVQLEVPMRDDLHNRHIRLVGQAHGLFAEAVRPITGLRRDPGADARQAQIDGKATSPADWSQAVSENIERIPAWGDFRLTQLCADGFQIRKRTKPGCGWIPAGAGGRAGGCGYVGGTSGGVSFGIRDFWQKHPGQIDICNAAAGAATVNLWLYSPEAPAMDLRMYHDVMGMDSYDKQNEGLAITYEDYEPGYGTPFGIARTSELSLKIEPTTPSRDALVAFADIVRKPPQLMAGADTILHSGVFGAQWTLPDRSTPKKAWLEDHLSQTLDQYLKEIDQRSWYGFWDYGDIMHSYDDDRHVWRYDIGGYAWDNCELSSDLWLWLSVLRTGRADLFRMAEALTRHTGEVDVYHLGRFQGLGTRHGVQHWADSSKQSRISTPIYRRFYYYLTADERTGDLLEEQMHTIEAEKKIVVGRKLTPHAPTLPLPPVDNPPPGGDVRFDGLKWGNAMAAWVTHAERAGDAGWHQKIMTAMNGIGRMPHGFYTEGWTMNIDTGEVADRSDGAVGVSHLMACFGLPEIANELVSLYGRQAPGFIAAWAQYGRLYGGTDEQRAKELGSAFKRGMFKEASLVDSTSRCTAFAAKYSDPKLASRAWAEFEGRNQDMFAQPALRHVARVVGPQVLNPIDELPMGTNGAAQGGLAAIENLALIGDSI